MKLTDSLVVVPAGVVALDTADLGAAVVIVDYLVAFGIYNSISKEFPATDRDRDRAPPAPA